MLPWLHHPLLLLADEGWTLLPEQASDTATRVDLLTLGLLGVTSLFTLLVAGLIALFAVRYRRSSPAPRGQPSRGQLPLELTWIAVPTAIGLGLFVWSAVAYVRLFRPAADAVVIDVVGRQWMWKVQHATGRREIDELHLEVGRPVKLVLTSQDVIHSFYVPAFRVKRDVLPSRYTVLAFRPTRVGEYRLLCAEYCGTEHSHMRGRVVVLAPTDYQRWVSGEPPQEAPSPGTPGAPDAPLALRGQGAFFRFGCNACHLPSSAVRAPRLDGLFGREVRLASDERVVADEAYLRAAILRPNAQMTAGYPAPSLMPSYGGQLTERDVDELIGFIAALRDGWPEALR